LSKWAIDLGTTNSCITRWNDKLGQPEIINLKNISRENIQALDKLEMPSIVPSTVFVLPHDRFKTKLGLMPFFSKRFFIGKQGLIGMEAIKENLNLRRTNFISTFKQQLIYDPSQIIAKVDNLSFTASQVTYIFLRELFYAVKKQTGERPRNMVFTTPVDSYETYRFQLKEISKRLGIKKFRVLDEPVAAAVGYGLNLSGKKIVLVFDFGGGTLDLALVEIDYGSIETGKSKVIAKEGLGIGGNVIDVWILNEFFERTGYDLSDKLDNSTISMWYRILLEEACRVKEHLYIKNIEHFLVNPPEYFRNLNHVVGKDVDKLTQFTKNDLVDILTKNRLYEMLDEIIEKLLDKARKYGITPLDINEVLVVGGSSLLPKVYSILEEKFGRDKIRAWQPFEAVAFGAACYAADKIVNSDFITHNYAFVTYDRKTHKPQYNIIVPEGTKFPTKKDFWKRHLIPTCSLGEPEKVFKLVICEIGLKKNSRSFVWDEHGRMVVLNRDTEEPLIIPLNETNPTLGYLNPAHSPSDNTPRLEVAFYVNKERWLCTNVFDLKTKRYLMIDTPVVRLQ